MINKENHSAGNDKRVYVSVCVVTFPFPAISLRNSYGITPYSSSTTFAYQRHLPHITYANDKPAFSRPTICTLCIWSRRSILAVIGNQETQCIEAFRRSPTHSRLLCNWQPLSLRNVSTSPLFCARSGVGQR